MTTTNTPTTATQALAQARRYDRARQILDLGYSFTEMSENNFAVTKPGRLAASYWITDGACSCPDALRNPKDTCKHIYSLQILQDEQAAEQAGLEALCQEYDDFEGFMDRIPTPTPVSIAIKDIRKAWETELTTVQAAIQQHGPRRSNYIQCQQEYDHAGRLEGALILLSQTKL